MSKYHSRRVSIDGIVFDSQREAQRYCELKLLEKKGKISQLALQVPFVLVPAEVDVNKKKLRQIVYVADVVYLDEKLQKHVVDAKGVKTAVYKLKKRLMWHLYNITIEEV